jgi:hypothetical protein
MLEPQNKSSPHLDCRILTQLTKGVARELQRSKFGFLRNHEMMPLLPDEETRTGRRFPKCFDQTLRGLGISKTLPVTDIRTPVGSVTGHIVNEYHIMLS